MTTLADKIEALAKDVGDPETVARMLRGVGIFPGTAVFVEEIPTILRALRERDQAVEALKRIAPGRMAGWKSGEVATEALASIEGTGHE